jgi:hypothetical protein
VQKLLYADLGGDTLAESLASAGSDFSFGTLIQGTKLKLGFRLVEEVEGEYVEVDREVLSIRAKIGELYAQPASGTFRIWIGDIDIDPVEGVNLTIEIAVGAAASVVQAALNNLSLVGSGGGALYGTASVTLADGSYFVTFAGETTQTPLRGANLRPDVISFLRVWASAQDGIWTHELRLDKAGLAFADQIIEELPAAPIVSTFRTGVDNGDGTGINAIQKIQFNPRFRGIYEVHWSDRQSPLLSRDDGPDQFGEALTVLAEPDGEFIVTNPSPNIGMVQFSGSMGMQPQAALAIVVVDNPAADRYVVLDLGEKVCADVLRQMELDDADEIDVPLEVEIRYEDETDEDLVLVWLWQRSVTVRRRLIREGEATVNDTDYMRPINSRSYRRFNASQHANGVAFYPFELGDGVLAIHTIDHDLHTLLVDVDLRENAPGGAWLVEGTDYRVNYDDEGTGEDSIVITLLGDYASDPPEEGDLIGVVVGRNVVSEFQEDVTWEMEQVNGLITEFNALKARVTVLEAHLPTEFGRPDPTLGAYLRESGIPNFSEVYPAQTRAGINRLPIGSRMDVFDPTTLGRGVGRLFGALHKESTTSLDTIDVVESGVKLLPTPSASFINTVYINDVGQVIDVPGGGGHPSRTLAVGELVACDGDYWYKVVQYGSGSSKSYYPVSFERTLFYQGISGEDLISGREMAALVDLEIGLLEGAESGMVYYLAWEIGTWPSDTTPATTGGNLQNIIWSAAAAHEERLLLTTTPARFSLGYRVTRDGDTLAATVLNYGVWKAATQPAATDFAVRLRLIRADTENAASTPNGRIFLSGPTFDNSVDGVGKVRIF